MSTKHLIQSFETGKVLNKQQKHVLIVYAHQEPKSFNGAMLQTAVESLRSNGHSVEVSDLYSMHFEPRADKSDITGPRENPEFFKYQMETKTAYENDALSDDIKVETEKLKRADLVIFQFPLYWFSYPAIMKGWLDRVYVMGFAYGFPKLYSDGPMKGKKAMLSITTGGPEACYSPSGMNGDINVILWPMQHGTLHFVGFDVLAPQIYYSVARASPEDRAQWLSDWSKRLNNIFEEKPISAVHFSNFTPLEMKEEYKASQDDQQYAPSVGYHLGKPIRPNSMTKA